MQSGLRGARRHGSLLMMTLMVTAVIMLIVDLAPTYARFD